jgi:hypothetical protein
VTLVEFAMETTVPPDRLRAGLLDFSERRPELWPELDPDAYEVYEVGDTWAVVREGSRSPRIWAKERYDWSDPALITWTVEESNFCAPGSSVRARIEPSAAGGSIVQVRWERVPVDLKTRLMFAMISLTGGRPVKASLRRSFDHLERRADL